MILNKIYKHLLVYAAIVIWIVTVLHFLAMRFYLYWTFSWFDILMHGLGGLVIGLLAGALVIRFFPMVLEYAVLFFILVLGTTLLVGFLWEVFEFILDLTVKMQLYQPSVPDTMVDIVMDMIGGCIAGIIGIVTFKAYAK